MNTADKWINRIDIPFRLTVHIFALMYAMAMNSGAWKWIALGAVAISTLLAITNWVRSFM